MGISSVEAMLAPFVFRVLALELFFDLGISLFPERDQVFRDLDWTMVWGEDLNPDGNLPATDG